MPWVYCVNSSGVQYFREPIGVHILNKEFEPYFSLLSEVHFMYPRMYAALQKKFGNAALNFFHDTGISEFPGIHFPENSNSVIEGFEEFLVKADIISSRAFVKILLISLTVRFRLSVAALTSIATFPGP